MKLIVTIALLSGLTLAETTSYQKRAEDPLYYIGYCQDALVSIGGVVELEHNQDTRTASACNQLGGKSCERGCVITGDKDTPDLTRSLWEEGCRAEGARDAELVRQYDLLREAVMEIAGC